METLRFTRAFADSLKQEGAWHIGLKEHVLAFAHLNKLLAAVPEYFHLISRDQVVGQASHDLAAANGIFASSSDGPRARKIGYLGFWSPDQQAFIFADYQVWKVRETKVFADYILLNAITARKEYLGL